MSNVIAKSKVLAEIPDEKNPDSVCGNRHHHIQENGQLDRSTGSVVVASSNELRDHYLRCPIKTSSDDFRERKGEVNHAEGDEGIRANMF